MDRLADINPEIVECHPLGRGRLRLKFRHGAWTENDLAYLIEIGGIFAQLADDEFLQQVVIGDYGHWLEWPGEVDAPADDLWARGKEIAVESLHPRAA